jgi:hypothetical protein
VKTCSFAASLAAASDAPRASGLLVEKAARIASVLKSTFLFGIALALPATAGAGSTGGASSNHKFGVVIHEGTSSWTVDMTGLLSYNASTGALSMPATATPLGAGWEWAPITLPGSSQTLQGIKWHSEERNEDDSAWRSTFTFTASGNVDPFMNYAFSAKNNTGVAQTYTFTYGEALIPAVSGFYDIYADIAGGVTNGTGSSVKVDPTISDLLGDNDGIDEIQILRLSADGGGTFVNAGVDVGQAIEAAGTATYGVYSSSLSTTTSVPYNYWEITTQFTLSPGKDTAVFTGFVEIIPDSEANIPEPSTYALVAGAFTLGFAALLRRAHSVREPKTC